MANGKTNSQIKPWDQQPGEKILWYSRFQNYYLPLEGSINLQRAWDHFVQKEKKGNKRVKNEPDPNWRNAAKRDRWPERKAAFDKEKNRRVLVKLAEKISTNHVTRLTMGLELQRLISLGINAKIATIRQDDIRVSELVNAFDRVNKSMLPDMEKVIEAVGAPDALDEGVEALDVEAMDHILSAAGALVDFKQEQNGFGGPAEPVPATKKKPVAKKRTSRKGASGASKSAASKRKRASAAKGAKKKPAAKKRSVKGGADE